MTHVLGWQDGGAASVVRCDGEALGGDEWLASSEEAKRCPRCLKWFRLKWDVELVEVRDPEGRVLAARAALSVALLERAEWDAARGVYRCASCHENIVDPHEGEDTCRACLARV